MQQSKELRDINIIYNQLSIPMKVEMSKIVCQFFKYQLKKFGDQFDKKAKQQKKSNYKSLKTLEEYDVTLNSYDRNSSVMQSGCSFGSYHKNKYLRFYVQPIEGQSIGPISNDQIFTFAKIQGNTPTREITLNIKNMNRYQFEKKIKQAFNIDSNHQILYKNMTDNTFFHLENNSLPIKQFNQKRLKRIGINPVYQAGGVC